MSLKPPTSVKVGTSKFPVAVVDQYPPDYEDNAYGLTDTALEMIWMKSDQSEGQLKDTMLHEVLHAIKSRGYIQIKSDDEERMIQQLTPWLLLVLQENPQLVKYLTEKVK